MNLTPFEITSLVLILFFSIILHEVSHGFVAFLNGDTTAKDAGRLTLNPLPHIDPLGTILLPAMLILMKVGVIFGWAKPVPFNPLNFRNRNFGTFTVAIAGPVTNIILAVLFAIAWRGMGADPATGRILYYATAINLFLAILNMIPIPPLDGSRAVGAFLPPNLQRAYYSLERWGFFILIALFFTGILQRIILPIYQALFSFLMGTF